MLRSESSPSVHTRTGMGGIDAADDLRERMRMLQGDRKANMDLLESTKVANREEAKGLKEEIAMLRQKLSKVHRGGDGSGGSTDGDAELKDAQREVNRWRRIGDEIRAKSSSLRTQLQSLNDKAHELELESKSKNMENSPHSRNIRILENRLDKAMIKYNEAQSIQRTYEQIVRRLKEERLGFDGQLSALERTLAAKQRDCEELSLLSGDACHARDAAQHEVERMRKSYEQERRRREQELRERHQVLMLRRQMKERVEKRERVKAEIAAEEATASGLADESGTIIDSVTSAGLQQTRDEYRSRIDVFENAFRKIKEATGVSDVREVIQKVVNQESTAENLMQLTKENQGRIENLKSRRDSLKARVEDMKYSGPGEGHRRKMVDDHEKLLAASAVQLERAKNKYGRIAKVHISAKAGVAHLQNKLRNTADDEGISMVPMKDDTVVEVLEVCNRVMAAAIAHIQLVNGEPATGSSALQLVDTGSTAGEDQFLLEARPFNQRVVLPGAHDRTESEREEAADLDEDAITRERVKKSATKIVVKEEKKRAQTKSRQGGGDS